MFSRILVPFDGRNVSAIALTPALTVARATDASVRLVTVVDGDATPAIRAAAETTLQYVASGLAAKGVAVDTTVRAGAAADEIIAAATEGGADLIAMATHGRSGLTRAFMGSVAERVLKASPIPVLLLRPGGEELTGIKTILVPVDGSPGGALALATAVALARSAAARVILLQVVVPFLAYQTGELGMYGGIPYIDPAWDQESLEGARRYVTGLAARLNNADVQAEGMAKMGDILTSSTSVVQTIIATADEVHADIIVMSTHAHTGPARMILGSVADALVRNAHRPVLLIRRDGVAEASDEVNDEVITDAAPT